jgi:hypothetical protein
MSPFKPAAGTGSGITQLTGDVSTPSGSGSQVATLEATTNVESVIANAPSVTSKLPLAGGTMTGPIIGFEDKGGQVYNVMAYGAKGDGVTDDSAAIQSAINAAELHNGVAGAYGATVYFPAGAYLLTAAGLTIGGNGITLQGAGQLSTRIFVANNATITPITVSGTGATPGVISTYSENVVIRDLLVDMSFGTASAGPANNTPGVIFNYVTRPKLVDASITNFGTCLLASGTTDLMCSRVNIIISNASVTTAYGVKIDGTYQNASAYFHQVVVGIGNFTGTTSYAWFAGGAHLADLYLHFCEGNGATDSFYYDGSSAATFADVLDVHLIQYVADQCVRGIEFLNLVETGGMANIDGGWYASSVANGTAVTASNASGVHVRGMQMYDSHGGGYGILFISGSKDCTAVQNIVKGEFQVPIYVDNSSYCSIVGNTLVTTVTIGANAVQFISGSDCVVADNIIRASSGVTLYTGVYIDAASSNIRVSSNVINSASTTNGPITIVAGSTGIRASGNVGYNPRGSSVTQPAVAISGTAVANNTGVDCTVFVNGGTVAAVAIGGTATGQISGPFRVPAGQTITLTYSVAPTWQWFGD